MSTEIIIQLISFFLSISILIQNLELMNWQKSKLKSALFSDTPFWAFLYSHVYWLGLVGLSYSSLIIVINSELPLILLEAFKWLYVFTLILQFAVSLRLQYILSGPVCGGSDYMTQLTITTLVGVFIFKDYQEIFLGFLATQVLLSYLKAGWVKWTSKNWRSGGALQNIILHSSYKIPRFVKKMSINLALVKAISWMVIIFEVSFFLSLSNFKSAIIFCITAVLFHLGVWIAFGLNRFFWTWLTALFSILWLAQKIS